MPQSPWPSSFLPDDSPHASRIAERLLVALALLYLLVGMIGHEPWRGADMMHFGITQDLLRGGWLWLPMLEQERVPATYPLFYWVAAGLTHTLSGVLPAYDAARLATSAFLALCLGLLHVAGRTLLNRGVGTAAALLLLGTLGLVVHAHNTEAASALLAALALSYAGFGLRRTRPWLGSALSGLGLAAAFFSGGLGGWLLTLPLLLAVRTDAPDGKRMLRAALTLTLGLVPALLWMQMVLSENPAAANAWLTQEIARFTPTGLPRDAHLSLLGWFLWPLWPIALWTLWRERQRLNTAPWCLLGLAFGLASLSIFLRPKADEVDMLVLLPALALLAAAGIPSLRRGAANAFDWFAVCAFAVFAALVWMAWSAMTVQWPPGLARHLARTGPDFDLALSLPTLGVGLAICLLWGTAIWRLPKHRLRGALNWAAGMTMLWCLAVLLLQPWFDHQKNERAPFVALAAFMAEIQEQENLAATELCIAGRGMGPSQQAAARFYAELQLRSEALAPPDCRYRLARGIAPPPEAHDPSWQALWEFRRGGNRQLEVYRLYRSRNSTIGDSQ